MDETRIRPYVSEDLDSVLEIWEQASHTGHPFLSDSFLAAEREKVRDVHLPLANTWILEDHGELVGFISLIEDEVGALFVHPGSHRRGVGSALMEFAMSRFPTLVLEVFKENSSARAFYERCGFTVASGHLHPETGHEMLRMRYDPATVGDSAGS